MVGLPRTPGDACPKGAKHTPVCPFLLGAAIRANGSGPQPDAQGGDMLRTCAATASDDVRARSHPAGGLLGVGPGDPRASAQRGRSVRPEPLAGGRGLGQRTLERRGHVGQARAVHEEGARALVRWPRRAPHAGPPRRRSRRAGRGSPRPTPAGRWPRPRASRRAARAAWAWSPPAAGRSPRGPARRPARRARGPAPRRRGVSSGEKQSSSGAMLPATRAAGPAAARHSATARAASSSQRDAQARAAQGARRGAEGGRPCAPARPPPRSRRESPRAARAAR